MTPIKVNTVPFFNLATASPFTGAPYFFTNNDTMVFVWPIGLSIGSKGLKGAYFTLLKDTGEYCSFYTYDKNDESFNSVLVNTAAVWINRNIIFIVHKYSFTAIQIPSFTTNGSITRTYSSIHYPYGSCSDYDYTTGILAGPYIDIDNITIGFYGTSFSGTSYGYGLVYDVRNGFTLGDHIFQNNILVEPFSYGINSSAATQCCHNGSHYGGDTTPTIIYSVYDKITYDATIRCYTPVPPAPAGSNNGTFGLLNVKNFLVNIPDLQWDYGVMDSDNPYVRIFSAWNGAQTNFYMYCQALNYGQLFQTSENINAYTSAYFKQKAYFSVNNFIHVTSTIVPNLLNIPDVSNSNGPPISSAGPGGASGGGNQTMEYLNNNKSYLINMNRPISPIGAYKT